MKKFLIPLIIVVAAGGVYLLVAPGNNMPEADESPTPSESVSPSPTAAAPVFVPTPTPTPTPGILIQESAVHTVDISNFTYLPETVTVRRGDVVSFINFDSTPHTVTADNGAFDSGNLGSQQEWVLTTANMAPGTYTYHCTYHPNMQGTIVVQ